MTNPFEIILERLASMEEKLTAASAAKSADPIEIINREELCKRLGITEPTAIRMEKRNRLPVMRIGTSVRYNWYAVVAALGKQKGLK